ncbi:MAG: hypothetical protein IPG70_13050 [Moraxellaceae bacterium]|nr:hypothetical protein [Moraxellaceae bacterium]
MQPSLPLYRLEQIARRQQVPLPRSTLSSCGWRVGLCTWVSWLSGWSDVVTAGGVLHISETPVQQLDSKAKLVGTKKPICGRIAGNGWTRGTLSWYLIIKGNQGKVVVYVRF